MDLQVLPLKVLVSREVVGNKMDYSTYLNGTTKEELDQLKKMTGHFKIETECDLRIVGDEQPEFYDIEQVIEYLKESLKDDTAGGLVTSWMIKELSAFMKKKRMGGDLGLFLMWTAGRNIFCQTQALGRKPILKGFRSRITLCC